MFISNIICKLSAIIHMPEIIYKATIAPTNKDQYPCSTNVNTGSIEPLYMTCSHTQHTTTSLCLSLTYTSSIIAFTFFTLLTHIFT